MIGMTLDPATLFLVLIGFCLVSGVGLGMRLHNRPGDRHLGYWCAAFLLGALGLTGLAFRAYLPPRISIDAANAVALIAFGLAWNGIRVFTGRRPNWWVVATAPAIWLVACQVPVIYASQPFRTAVASGLITILTLMLAQMLWARGKENLPARVPLAALCTLHAGATLVRAIVALVVGLDGNVDLDPLFISIGLLEPIFVLFGVVIFGLVLTQQRRELVLSRKAALDGLTGLLNRGAFIEEAASRLAAAQADGRNAALLVFDIDYFKEVNDSFGHAAGDRALAAFAAAARQVVRATDPVGRLGGEEFATLLVGADREVGAAIAERIRAEFARRASLLESGRLRVTASAGVAATDSGHVPLETLMLRADEALYAAKRAGRDLVSHAAE